MLCAILEHIAPEEPCLLVYVMLEVSASRRPLLCRNASLVPKVTLRGKGLQTALSVPMERLLRPQGLSDASLVHQGALFRMVEELVVPVMKDFIVPEMAIFFSVKQGIMPHL